MQMQEEREIKDAVKRVFAKNAQKFVTSESHAKGSDLSQLVEWLNPQPNWVVLDIATGGGHVAKTLAPHVGHVFATDLTHQMLANTAKHLTQHAKNVWYVLADAESLPFLDNSFDCVTCRIAPHHFPNPHKFIEEVHRVLSPGGRFILSDNVAPPVPQLDTFMNTFEKIRDVSHVRCLSIKEWRELFASTGLIEKKSAEQKKFYDFPKWVARTADSQEQIDRVSQYILQADDQIKDYFSVTIEEDQVKSLEVDAWLVMCEKKQ
jgi:ubiquinone/menaquinone biosynthesis C-methylase UbiE